MFEIKPSSMSAGVPVLLAASVTMGSATFNPSLSASGIDIIWGIPSPGKNEPIIEASKAFMINNPLQFFGR